MADRPSSYFLKRAHMGAGSPITNFSDWLFNTDFRQPFNSYNHTLLRWQIPALYPLITEYVQG